MDFIDQVLSDFTNEGAMDVLEDVLSNTPHIKLIYAIPTFQNPTGKTWSLERRRKLA